MRVARWFLEHLEPLTVAAGFCLLVTAAAMVDTVAGVAAAGVALVLAGSNVRWPR